MHFTTTSFVIIGRTVAPQHVHKKDEGEPRIRIAIELCDVEVVVADGGFVLGCVVGRTKESIVNKQCRILIKPVVKCTSTYKRQTNLV